MPNTKLAIKKDGGEEEQSAPYDDKSYDRAASA